MIGKAKAVAFIKSANRKIYGKLLMSIREQHSFKIDVYPKTLADAYKMCCQPIRPTIITIVKTNRERTTEVTTTTPTTITITAAVIATMRLETLQ